MVCAYLVIQLDAAATLDTQAPHVKYVSTCLSCVSTNLVTLHVASVHSAAHILYLYPHNTHLGQHILISIC